MMNKLSKIYGQVYMGLIVALAFVLPFGFKLISLLIALLIVVSLLRGKFKEGVRKIKYPGLILLFSSLYILYLVGFSYSENMHYGLKDMETKLSLLLFPLIFINIPSNNTLLKKTFLSFITGCLMAFISCLILVYFEYGTTDSQKFFYSALSRFLHPGYFSMYITLAICMVMYLWREKGFESKLKKYLLVLSGLILLSAQVLLSAKSAILATLVLFVIVGVYLFIKSKRKVLGAALFLLTAITISAGINQFDFLKGRILTVKNALQIKKVDRTAIESSAVRIIIWEAAGEIIKEHPVLGVGTGDVKDALLQKYAEKGMVQALEKRLNAHSQFVQVTVALGFFGLLLFVCSLLIPLVLAIREKNYIYTFFLILITISFLTESMLETQAGVIFYAFFNSFLYAATSKKEEAL